MKRARSDSTRSSYTGKKYKVTGSYTGTGRAGQQKFVPPMRTYKPSMVPSASRGYKPNAVEKKVYDIAPGAYNANTTGDIRCLALPTLGTDMTNRIGRKIVLKSVYIKGMVQMESAANPTTADLATGNLTRIIIFADMQPNGALPAVTDVLNSALPQSHLNLNNRDRFKIYCDKMYYMDPMVYNTTATQAVACWGNTGRAIKIYKRLNLETIFNATNGGTIADISSGALLILTIGNVAAGTRTDADFSLGIRVRFADV